MTKRFGHTYWGNRWLSSLETAYQKNRLARGKSPAGKGSVLHFQQKGTGIFARVRSTGKNCHNQIIKVPGFSDREKSVITRTICNSPHLLSRILYKDLPRDLEHELSKTDISLFPEAWKGLSANCSCSDWSMPCQHVSAVLYYITCKIDSNPFFFLELRGLDIESLLASEGHNQEEKKSIFFSMDSILSGKNSIPGSKKDNKEPASSGFSRDFWTIPKVGKNLLQLLQADPLFYDKADFKKLYARAMGRSGALAAKLFEAREPVKKIKKTAAKNMPGEADFDMLQSIRLREDFTSYAVFPDSEYKLDDNWLAFFDYFFRGKTEHDLADKSVIIRFLYQVYSFSLVLLKQGAVIPQLIQLEKMRFKIRWLPAEQCPEVKKMTGCLTDSMPFELLGFLGDTKSGQKPFFPSAGQQLLTLVSLFLGSGIKTACYRELQDFDRMYHLFFGNGVFSTAYREEEVNIPHTIHLWLSRFYIIHKEVSPVVKIEHTKGGYTLDILINRSNDGDSSYLTLAQLFDRDDLKETRQDVLSDLEHITGFIPQLSRLCRSRGREKVSFSSADFEDFFYKVLPVLKLLGIELLIPRQMYKVVNPRLTLHLTSKPAQSGGVSYFSLDNMVSFEWKIALGSTVMAPGEFKKLVDRMEGIVFLQDQFVLINHKQISQILKKSAEKDKLSEKELVQAVYDETFEDAPVSISDEVRKVIREYKQLPEIAQPDLLRATLRHYQLTGYRWLYKNIKNRTGSLLADDMGLGKTIQVCALLAKLKEEHYFLKEKCLIVVPTSLLSNWKEELRRFTPYLTAIIYHGLQRSLDLAGTDIVITTYGIIRSEEELFTSIRWELLIIDEAQNIKNGHSSQARSIKKLESHHNIALSGTPVENRLSEYWSIFDFIQKDFLGSLELFNREFAVPIEKYRDTRVLEHFKSITSPFTLRRLKTDKSIIDDLPDKLEFDEYCSLTGEQSAAYQSIVNSTMNTIENSTGIQREGLILKMMTGLKQVCNHPGHYTKARRINPEGSGKTMLLIETLEKIFERQEKVLIFTQFARMGELLQNLIKESFNIQTPFLHGGISRKLRDSMVKSFQTDSKTRSFLLSLMAGGTGLNLTSASYVIHFDLWWNPAVESQATDRAFRIGQKKNVMVYRFITKGTFEEKINTILQEKKELARLAVETGSRWLSELSDGELKEIVKLD